MLKVSDYISDDGYDPFKKWLESLLDRQARARILVRIQRLAAGNFGDCKPIAEGIWELRIDHGAGYRVYYAKAGEKLILILAGGDKRRQQTDIETALEYWNNWKRKNKA
ncbi:putative addiction module killer protein [Nitrosomonas sp. Nm84]|uniref:type II toxin-antitoxin system RelE/ParE family toxin n=1 Tax=Nitrosomonas sp. Nm84 TaxID=200124 RepID=UPI000D7702B1|nr:type II toxin-antitoxin system RelE/ParE family toxin [Nitrosomonas sp. Nm84]PXW85777.1 putative addiction module killer protein [Nitrosomonas sp. Nm84]